MITRHPLRYMYLGIAPLEGQTPFTPKHFRLIISQRWPTADPNPRPRQ